MNCIIFLIALSLYIKAVKACGTVDASKSTTCADIYANSNLSCEDLCKKEGLSPTICSDAAPTLKILVLEGCVGGTYLWGPTAHCLWKYRSELLKQDICITKALLEDLKSGILQYELALFMLKNTCDRNHEGQRSCIKTYGYIKCTSGSWGIEHLCTPGSCSMDGNSPYCSVIPD